MAGNEIDEISIALKIDTSAFSDGLDDARASLQSFIADTKRLVNEQQKSASALAGASTPPEQPERYQKQALGRSSRRAEVRAGTTRPDDRGRDSARLGRAVELIPGAGTVLAGRTRAVKLPDPERLKRASEAPRRPAKETIPSGIKQGLKPGDEAATQAGHVTTAGVWRGFKPQDILPPVNASSKVDSQEEAPVSSLLKAGDFLRLYFSSKQKTKDRPDLAAAVRPSGPTLQKQTAHVLPQAAYAGTAEAPSPINQSGERSHTLVAQPGKTALHEAFSMISAGFARRLRPYARALQHEGTGAPAMPADTVLTPHAERTAEAAWSRNAAARVKPPDRQKGSEASWAGMLNNSVPPSAGALLAQPASQAGSGPEQRPGLSVGAASAYDAPSWDDIFTGFWKVIRRSVAYSLDAARLGRGLTANPPEAAVPAAQPEPATEKTLKAIFNIVSGSASSPDAAGLPAGGGAAAVRLPHAIKALVGLGWSKEQATGIAANLVKESGLRADAVGDGGKAYGIAQWHPDRQESFRRLFGHDMRQSTFEEQLRFLNWELNNSESRAGSVLRQQTDAGASAAVVSELYERPLAIEAEKAQRAQIAKSLLPYAANPAVMAAAAPVASSTTNHAPVTVNVHVAGAADGYAVASHVKSAAHRGVMDALQATSGVG